MESRGQLVGGWLGDGGIEQKGKRTHGHEKQCGDCSGGIKRLSSNGKNTVKVKILKH